MALNRNDFNFKKQEVSISKTYHHSKGEDIITSPKTKQSVRVVSMPDFLCQEIQDYFSVTYTPGPEDRTFPATKSYLKREMRRGTAASGVQRIRVHDLRHSHVSLLIHMGYSAVAIGKRVGHKSIDITYRYAHLFPSIQTHMASSLNELRKESGHVTENA